MGLALLVLLQTVAPERFLLTRTQPPLAQPAPVQAIAPAFPDELLESTKPVTVTAVLEVDAEGRTVRAQVPDSAERLPKAAVRAVLETVPEWHFPSSAAAHEVKLSFVFRTMPAGTPREQLTTIFRNNDEVEVRAARKAAGVAK
jgi:hypothetical protein